ncbi:HNH endonuclease [Viridibacillus arvi]|uniref:HNH endonuclease n=2 Tax=Viridibacillus arvi TaxID=263475 RepID=UPI003D0673B8
MTSKPLKPCNKHNCGRLTTTRYCEAHTTETTNDNRYYDKHHRDKRSNSFYHSTAWRKARQLAILESRGMCVSCFNDNRLVPGYIVDHIIPIKVNWLKRLDLDNLQYLCKACHNKKTAEDKK